MKNRAATCPLNLCDDASHVRLPKMKNKDENEQVPELELNSMHHREQQQGKQHTNAA